MATKCLDIHLSNFKMVQQKCGTITSRDVALEKNLNDNISHNETFKVTHMTGKSKIS